MGFQDLETELAVISCSYGGWIILVLRHCEPSVFVTDGWMNPGRCNGAAVNVGRIYNKMLSALDSIMPGKQNLALSGVRVAMGVAVHGSAQQIASLSL
jgi:hypothetical protein